MIFHKMSPRTYHLITICKKIIGCTLRYGLRHEQTYTGIMGNFKEEFLKKYLFLLNCSKGQ